MWGLLLHPALLLHLEPLQPAQGGGDARPVQVAARGARREVQRGGGGGARELQVRLSAGGEALQPPAVLSPTLLQVSHTAPDLFSLEQVS